MKPPRGARPLRRWRRRPRWRCAPRKGPKRPRPPGDGDVLACQEIHDDRPYAWAVGHRCSDMSREAPRGLGPTPAAAPLDSMLDGDRLRLGDIAHLAALDPDHLRVGQVGPATPAQTRGMGDHLVGGVGHLQGLARSSGLLARLAGLPTRRGRPALPAGLRLSLPLGCGVPARRLGGVPRVLPCLRHQLLDPRRHTPVLSLGRLQASLESDNQPDQLRTRQTLERLGRQLRSGTGTSRDGRTSQCGSARYPPLLPPQPVPQVVDHARLPGFRRPTRPLLAHRGQLTARAAPVPPPAAPPT